MKQDPRKGSASQSDRTAILRCSCDACVSYCSAGGVIRRESAGYKEKVLLGRVYESEPTEGIGGRHT